MLNLNGGKYPCNPSSGSCNIFHVKEFFFEKKVLLSINSFERHLLGNNAWKNKIVYQEILLGSGEKKCTYVVLPKTSFSLKKKQVLCGFARNIIFIKNTTGSLWFCLKHKFHWKNNRFFVVLPETQFSLKKNRFFVVLPETQFSLRKQQVLCGFARNTIFIKNTTGSLFK